MGPGEDEAHRAGDAGAARALSRLRERLGSAVGVSPRDFRSPPRRAGEWHLSLPPGAAAPGVERILLEAEPELVAAAERIPPGFVNLRLTAGAFRAVLEDLSRAASGGAEGRAQTTRQWEEASPAVRRLLRRAADLERMARVEVGVGEFPCGLKRLPAPDRPEARAALHDLLRALEAACALEGPDPAPRLAERVIRCTDALYAGIPMLRRPPEEVAAWIALFRGARDAVRACLHLG